MIASMGRAVHNQAERWRWLLYVVLAIVGALLTFVGARAQQKATDDATFRKMFDVNFNSAFYLLRAVIPGMRKTGNGRIVAIGSRAAMDPGPGVGAYSASKAALVSLIRTVAAENKDAGITANVILPGTIDTPANRRAIPNADVSKWVKPAKIASLVVWLAGEGGTDVNGAVISVYGKDV